MAVLSKVLALVFGAFATMMIVLTLAAQLQASGFFAVLIAIALIVALFGRRR